MSYRRLYIFRQFPGLTGLQADFLVANAEYTSLLSDQFFSAVERSYFGIFICDYVV